MESNNLKKDHKVLIIPVKEEHAEFINIIANNQELMNIFNDKSTQLRDWQLAIEEWLQDEDEKDFIIIRKEDKLPIGWIGINGLQSKDGSAWIKMIAILPEYWGKNFGSSTVKEVKDMLKSMGYKKVLLWTDEHNTRAQLCYRANNFKVIGEKKDTVGNMGIIKDRILMECSL